MLEKIRFSELVTLNAAFFAVAMVLAGTPALSQAQPDDSVSEETGGTEQTDESGKEDNATEQDTETTSDNGDEGDISFGVTTDGEELQDVVPLNSGPIPIEMQTPFESGGPEVQRTLETAPAVRKIETGGNSTDTNCIGKKKRAKLCN